MNKYKWIFVVFGIVMVGMAVVLLVAPRFDASKSVSVGLAVVAKSFPEKDPDIAPTMPMPKLAATSRATNSATSAKTQIVFVPRVIDGDTIVVEPVDPATGEPGKQETVRYIGMDTPETVSPTKPVECYGHEASARNKALVDGKYVAIAAGAGDKDKYGRLLRFVYLLNDSSTSEPDLANSSGVSLGAMVDLELVQEGYARVLTIPPNTEFAEQFNVAASSAQSMKLGFWGACAAYPFQ